MDESQRRSIAHAVEQRMQSFEAAERALDADAVIAHIAAGAGFYMHNDGHRLTYDAMASGVRSAFAALRSIQGGFHDVRVIVLAPDAALATAMFHEIVTDHSGRAVRQHGAATWLWRYAEGEWRMAYGHVDHAAQAPTE